MTIQYSTLKGGLSRRISETVFAGTHDASVTGGDPNAQTQNKNIGQQAAAGVRLFDLRILAQAGANGAELRGYHGMYRKNRSGFASHHKVNTGGVNSKHYKGLDGKSLKVERSKMMAGCFGESLHDMLTQGMSFLSGATATEFLIFKFDKCTNYPLIAKFCVDILGDTIFKDNGIEFYKNELNDLKGKIVCVFAEKGVREIAKVTGLDHTDGILGFRNLFHDAKAKDKDIKKFDPSFKGLQYQGKGGTGKSNTKKVGGQKDYGLKLKENEKKQTARLKQMAVTEQEYATNVLGMMYWTSTGFSESIKARDDAMWTPTGVKRMKELWHDCLKEGVTAQMDQSRAKVLNLGDGWRIKAFFPNFIMVDFAKEDRCQAIYSLNNARDDKLAEAYMALAG
jgi:hypothetical protein